MTAEQFNYKYRIYLEEGHYGLDIHEPTFITWLDTKFETFITQRLFSYTQIKTKYDIGRFYCSGLTKEQVNEVEDKITDMCKTNKRM
jgi:hypothetical protein